MAFEQFAQALPAPWTHAVSAEELARWLSAEMTEHALFPPAEAERKRLPQLMIFVSHCAPPGASFEALQLAGGFLFVFFLLNDGPVPVDSTYVGRWRAAFDARFGERGGRFSAAFEQYRRSLVVEQRFRERAAPPTLEEYVNREHGRYQWVATAPYLELWELTTNLRLSDGERAQAERMKTLGVELTYIANDMGSLRRDHRSANFVTLLVERYPQRTTLPELLGAARAEYEERARALRELCDGAMGELGRYASLVAAITDGNLHATLQLARAGEAGRYARETRDVLESLPRVTGR